MDPARLARRCAVDVFVFETTDELADCDELVGEQRAIDAIGFGIASSRRVTTCSRWGPKGAGRRALARRLIDRTAATRPVPYLQQVLASDRQRIVVALADTDESRHELLDALPCPLLVLPQRADRRETKGA